MRMRRNSPNNKRPHLFFLHTEKTGGSSIECATQRLEKNGLITNMGHTTYTMVQNCIPICYNGGLRPRLVISIRNPYSWWRSLYTYGYICQRAAVCTKLDFEAFMTSIPNNISQSHYITRACGNPCIADYVIRTERLIQDWNAVANEMQLPSISISHINPTLQSGTTPRTIFTTDVLSIIHDLDDMLFSVYKYEKRTDASFELPYGRQIPRIPFYIRYAECNKEWRSPHAGDLNACMQLSLNSVADHVPASLFDPTAGHLSYFNSYPAFILRNTTTLKAAYPLDVWHGNPKYPWCTTSAAEFANIAGRLAQEGNCSWEYIATDSHTRCQVNVLEALRYERKAVQNITFNCPDFATTWNQVQLSYTYRDIIGMTYDNSTKLIVGAFYNDFQHIFPGDVLCISDVQLHSTPVEDLFNLRCSSIFAKPSSSPELSVHPLLALPLTCAILVIGFVCAKKRTQFTRIKEQSNSHDEF